jgi:hypothetical protein
MSEILLQNLNNNDDFIEHILSKFEHNLYRRKIFIRLLGCMVLGERISSAVDAYSSQDSSPSLIFSNTHRSRYSFVSRCTVPSSNVPSFCSANSVQYLLWILTVVFFLLLIVFKLWSLLLQWVMKRKRSAQTTGCLIHSGQINTFLCVQKTEYFAFLCWETVTIPKEYNLQWCFESKHLYITTLAAKKIKASACWSTSMGKNSVLRKQIQKVRWLLRLVSDFKGNCCCCWEMFYWRWLCEEMFTDCRV